MDNLQEKLVAPLQELAIAKAKRLIEEGKYRVAEQGLLQVSHIGPSNAEVFHWLAVICARQRKFEEARTMWQTAIEIDPHNPNYFKGLQLCQSGNNKVPFYRRPLVGGLVGVAVMIVLVGAQFLQSSPQNIIVNPVAQEAPTAIAPQIAEEASAQSIIGITEILNKVESINRGSISVHNNGGILSVNGQVPTTHAYYMTGQLLHAQKGVKFIDISKLKVSNTVTVRPGDSLWVIAQEVYGNNMHWKTIAEKNGIDFPYRLHSGQELSLP